MGDRGRVARAWRAFHESLLFMPTLMTLGAVLLFAATSAVDARLAPGYGGFAAPGGVGDEPLQFLVFAGSPDSAARLLSAIVGTWATIAGVVYSVTLITITLSATKYSAQVIPVFEHDRLNQVVLGAFTSTFAYALLVLKTVRGGETPFVPLVGVNVSIVFALGSLALLIAFIGNLTAYIRPQRFVTDYARAGHGHLPRLVEPADVEGFEPLGESPEPEAEPALRVTTKRDGFVADISWGALRDVARRTEGVERVEVRVVLGRFVSAGDELARVHGAGLPDEVAGRLDEAILVDERPDENDPDRVAETLADIGVTALSGGATDVGVAKTALRGLMHLTSKGLEQEDPGPAFRVQGRSGTVVVVRDRERFHLVCYREMRRILTKATREGYWDLGEEFMLHAVHVFRHAARSRRRATWDETLEWWREVADDLLAFDEPRATGRMGRSLARVASDLRAHGQETEALDLEYVFLEAARRRGIEEQVRREVAAGH